MSGVAAPTRAPSAIPARLAAALDARTLVIAFTAVGLVIRLAIASRNLDIVDRLFIPDDSYYTLSIARSLAHGNGPAVQGVLTSGFQPLLAFLLTPVYAISHNPDTGLRASLLLGAVLDVGSALLLGRLAGRLWGTLAGVLAVAMWALSPIAVAQALNGLETSLAIFCSLLFAELWLQADERDGRLRFALAGLVAGLAVLARIDAVFLVGAFAVVGLVRRRYAGVVVAAVVALVVVAPWWIYCTIHFGSPVPESGGAVGELVSIHQRMGISVPQQMGRAAGQLIGAPLVSSKPLRAGLFDAPAIGVLAWLALVGGVAYAVWRVRRRTGPYALALAAAGIAMLAFYTFLLPAAWFYARYLAPAAALMTLVMAAAASSAWSARRRRVVDSSVLLGGLALLAAIGVGMTVPNLWRDPPSTPDTKLEGAKGYREVSRAILNIAPQGSVIGSLQSGALGYYAPKGVRVVNLDGVVDHRAAAALRNRRLGVYARSRGVNEFADWALNASIFIERSGIPGFSSHNLQQQTIAPAQGEDVFELYKVNWPR